MVTPETTEIPPWWGSLDKPCVKNSEYFVVTRVCRWAMISTVSMAWAYRLQHVQLYRVLLKRISTWAPVGIFANGRRSPTTPFPLAPFPLPSLLFLSDHPSSIRHHRVRLLWSWQNATYTVAHKIEEPGEGGWKKCHGGSFMSPVTYANKQDVEYYRVFEEESADT